VLNLKTTVYLSGALTSVMLVVSGFDAKNGLGLVKPAPWPKSPAKIVNYISGGELPSIYRRYILPMDALPQSEQHMYRVK